MDERRVMSEPVRKEERFPEGAVYVGEAFYDALRYAVMDGESRSDADKSGDGDWYVDDSGDVYLDGELVPSVELLHLLESERNNVKVLVDRLTELESELTGLRDVGDALYNAAYYHYKQIAMGIKKRDRDGLAKLISTTGDYENFVRDFDGK